MAAETREFTKRYFDILRKKEEQAEEAGDSLRLVIRETIAYADGRVTALLPVVRTLEERERTAAWERRKPELLALRAVVCRQLADALIGQARRLRLEPGEPARGESFAALGRAVSLLAGDRLAPGDARRRRRRDRLRSCRGKRPVGAVPGHGSRREGEGVDRPHSPAAPAGGALRGET